MENKFSKIGKRFWGPFLALAFFSQSSSVSAAPSTKILDYPYEAIWSAAIRLIRADNGWQIRDKDKENGYILFIFPGNGAVKECPASLEIIQIVDSEGYQHVKLQLDINDQPSYEKIAFLDKLELKLKNERGDPPPPKKHAKNPKKK